MIKKKITEMRVNRSIQIANKGGTSCKDFWKVLKGSSKKQGDVHCIKDPKTNCIVYDKVKMNLTVKQYWNTLGKMQMNMNDDDGRITDNVKSLVNLFRSGFNQDMSKVNIDINENNCLYDIEINMDIVLEALNLAKNNKSPGPDGITNELLKNGGECLHNTLLIMFKKFITLEKIPSEWNTGIIIPIFKKGDRNDLNYYRGICLTSCVAKIFNRIIAMSISKFLEKSNVLSEVQGGFRPEHRCEDHIFTLKSICASRLAEGKKTFLAFLDFRKAFDTVWREGLLLAAWNSGLRGKIWRMLDTLYDNVKAQVKFSGIETDFFDISEGVKQGCVLSPVLFCIFIHEFTKLLEAHDVGVRIHNIRVGSLFWADDVVLIANDEQELQKMLQIAAQFSKEWKLSFNHDKSNVLIVGQRTNKSKRWNLGNECISEVDSYKYLGVHISRNLTDHCHIQEVIKKGNRLIAYIKSLIGNFDDFDRVYYGDVLWRTIALPSINYASSVWIPSSQVDTNKLESLQLQMARFILKAPRNTPRAALYGDLGWCSLSTNQDIFRLKYLARIIDLDPHRWPKLLLNTMLSMDIDFAKLRYKFLHHANDVLNKCDLSDIIDSVKFGMTPEDPSWANSIKNVIKKISIDEWLNEARSKSSLKDYIKFKDCPSLESYLLDKTDFYGASLKFKLRSSTLPLDCKLSKWTPEIDGICTLCSNGIEDQIHFLFICSSLNLVRTEEFKKLEYNLTTAGFEDIWAMFISSDLDVKYSLTIGLNTLFGNDDILDIFDKFCKSYIKRAWKLRSVLKAAPLRSKTLSSFH